MIWRVGALVIAGIVALPMLGVASSLFTPQGDLWRHLAATQLTDIFANTLVLLIVVGLGTTIIGAGTAWLVTMCSFPGSRLLQWALLLPLVLPTYIIGYAYADLLTFAGPVQGALREATGWSRGDYWFPDLGSAGGVALLFTLVLYPYVYLAARTAFLTQSHALIEASRILGHGPWRTFFGVGLPLARPAIAAGVVLALLEALADFGTVQYYGVQTLTTAIYRTWYGLGNREGAAQIALVGPPNVGKSSLLQALSEIQIKTGDYPFTTLRPVPALTRIGGVLVQLVEIPGLIEGATGDRGGGRALLGVLRFADAIVYCARADADPGELRPVIDEVALAGIEKPAFLAATRADEAPAEGVARLRAAFPDLDVVPVSVIDEASLDAFREAVWQLTGLIRVHLRSNGQTDAEPLALEAGSSVRDVADAVHRDLATTLEGARVWGPSARFDGQRVGREHEVADGDTIEMEMDEDYFAPSVLSGPPGATVTIELTNDGTRAHSFKVPGQGINLVCGVRSHDAVTVRFPRSGTLLFRCTFGRGSGMRGAFVAIG